MALGGIHSFILANHIEKHFVQAALVADFQFYYIELLDVPLTIVEGLQLENCPINRVFIVGSGWVGRQIAAKMVQSGLEVTLYDRVAETTQDAMAWVRDAVGAKGDTLETVAPGGLKSTPNLPDSLEEAATFDLVLESVPEQISLKKRVLREVSRVFPARVILASNSSYFVPSLLTKYVSNPERFAHIHFHVPVLRESVVDIVGTEATDPAVLSRLQGLVEQLGIQPLLLRREHPGYVFNWMLQSLLRSALELAALDVVDPEDIDQSWKSVTGMAIGPFGMMDQIGLDVVEQVLANARWSEELEVPTEQLMRILRQHIDQGHLGRKSQQGFYRYVDDQRLI